MYETGLRYLLEAVNSGTMRAASDKLNIATSSISRQITQLEQQFGVTLIEKGRRSIKLTQAGQMAVEYYRNQLTSYEALQSGIKDLRSVKTGTIRIAVGEGFLSTAFTAMINGFKQKNPLVHIDLTVNSSQAIIKSVLEDEAHIGLVFQSPPEPKIRVRATAAQPLMAIVRADHELAPRSAISLQELGHYPLCLAPPDFRLRQILANAEARNQVFLESAMMTNSIFAMREAVRSGDLISILPQICVWSELQEGSMVGIPIADEGMEHTTVSLVLRAGRQLESAPTKLLTVIEAQFRNWTA